MNSMAHIPGYYPDCENMNTDFPYNLTIHHKRTPVEPHRHNFVEFLYVTSGSGYETINGQTHEMKPGTFTFLLPYQVHSIQVTGEVKFYNCSFPLDEFFKSDEVSKSFYRLFLLEEEAPAFVHFDEAEAREMEALLEDMALKFQKNTVWDRLLFRAGIIRLLTAFDQKRRISGKNGNESLGKTTTQEIWKVVFYIHAHYQEDIHVKELSKLFGMSPNSLSANFKKCTGDNISAFVHKTRISHAHALLSSTDMAVVDIAAEVGYDSYITFLRVFTKLMGKKPSMYKKTFV